MDWTEVSIKYLLPFAVGAVLMAAVNKILLLGLTTGLSEKETTLFRICTHPELAAIQEPFTSKLLPAIVVLLWAQADGRLPFLTQNNLKLSLAGGLTVGISEAITKWIAYGISLNSFPSIAMHGFTGLIVGAIVYRTGGKKWGVQDSLFVTSGLFSAVVIHYTWNTKVAFYLLELNPC